jgi:hypothetical protein
MVHEAQWHLVKTDEGNLLAIPPQLDLFQRRAGASDTEAVL